MELIKRVIIAKMFTVSFTNYLLRLHKLMQYFITLRLPNRYKSSPNRTTINFFLRTKVTYIINYIYIRLRYVNKYGRSIMYERLSNKVTLSLFTPDVAYEYNNALKQQLPQH